MSGLCPGLQTRRALRQPLLLRGTQGSDLRQDLLLLFHQALRVHAMRIPARPWAMQASARAGSPHCCQV